MKLPLRHFTELDQMTESNFVVELLKVDAGVAHIRSIVEELCNENDQHMIYTKWNALTQIRLISALIQGEVEDTSVADLQSRTLCITCNRRRRVLGTICAYIEHTLVCVYNLMQYIWMIENVRDRVTYQVCYCGGSAIWTGDVSVLTGPEYFVMAGWAREKMAKLHDDVKIEKAIAGMMCALQ